MDENNDFLNEAGSIEDSISISVPQFRNWNPTEFYDYESEIFDYEKLEELNKSTNSARLGLFQITDKINTIERHEKAARLAYERSHRRAYMRSSQKTEAARKAHADLQCEQLEDKYVVLEQVKQELLRNSHAIRKELEVLQAIGNNLRQQLKVE